jgi:hypothetical protein
MRALTAFFAGAGTVVIVVAAGLGGGLLIADTMNPKTPAQQASKLERRATPAPSPSSSPQAQSSTTIATNAPVAKPEANGPAAAPSPPPQPPARDAHDKPGAPDAAFAKARDVELKPSDADSKHGAERRHSRRHQQSTERPGMQRQPEPDPRDLEQASRDDGDARNARDDGGPRAYRDDNGARGYRDDSSVRSYRDDRKRGYAEDGSGRVYQDGRLHGDVAEPVELELPRIRLFDGF